MDIYEFSNKFLCWALLLDCSIDDDQLVNVTVNIDQFKVMFSDMLDVHNIAFKSIL